MIKYLMKMLHNGFAFDDKTGLCVVLCFHPNINFWRGQRSKCLKTRKNASWDHKSRAVSLNHGFASMIVHNNGSKNDKLVNDKNGPVDAQLIPLGSRSKRRSLTDAFCTIACTCTLLSRMGGGGPQQNCPAVGNVGVDVIIWKSDFLHEEILHN